MGGVIDAFLKALRQLPDARFQAVLWGGIAFSVGVLAALSWLLLWLLPDSISLPWLGEVGWLSGLLDGVALLTMLVLSVFLMVPVASLFVGFFLEWIADAVERKHYPGAGPARGASLGDSIREAIGFFGLVVAVNLLALVVYLLSTVAAPLVFWAVNGVLIGREYFQMVAMRRLGRREAQALRAAHRLEIWFAGAIVAVLLTVPVVNLVAPILGVAAFTHLYHRYARRAPRRASA